MSVLVDGKSCQIQQIHLPHVWFTAVEINGQWGIQIISFRCAGNTIIEEQQ